MATLTGIETAYRIFHFARNIGKMGLKCKPKVFRSEPKRTKMKEVCQGCQGKTGQKALTCSARFLHSPTRLRSDATRHLFERTINPPAKRAIQKCCVMIPQTGDAVAG